MPLFHALCEKVAEAIKFGQDFLSMEQLPLQDRHSVICSILIAKSDSSYAVRRLGTLLWKERLQSQQKAKAEVMPLLLRTLAGLKESGAPARVAAAEAALAELVSGGDAASVEEALAGVEPLAQSEALAADDVPQAPEEASEPPVARAQLLGERVVVELASVKLSPPLREYIETVVTSCCIETRTRASAEAAMETELMPIVEASVKAKGGSALAAFGLQPALDKVFDGVADEADRSTGVVSSSDDPEVLVRVENLMLMYGGGHLLLKNTTLELRKGHRYGVVGRNGAGKTTLMSTIASGGVQQIPSWVKTLHVRPEVLVEASELTAVQFCKRDSPESATEESLQAALQEVGFPKEMQTKSVNELSGGWRMKLLLASAMLRDCDVLLLDEPTNHLDKASVEWLSQYLCSQTRASLMVISHDPDFLNVVCTDIIQYSNQRTLEYYPGNFAEFRRAQNISNDDEAEALLLGYEVEDKDVPGAFNPPPRSGAGGEEGGDAAAADGDLDDELRVTAGALDKQSKITFPIPGKLQGHSSSKPVMELKNVTFAYDEAEKNVLTDISCKLTLNSRVGIIGRNGAGKSTLLNLLCGELIPTNNGEVSRNRNLRLAYIAQQHMYHLKEFMDCSPYTYMQQRYKNGWDEALQQRLLEPANEQEAQLRKDLAVRWGKYGNEVDKILGRVQRGNETLYEVQWMNLDDPKQNTYEPFSKLQKMGVSSFARAYDERFAAQTAGIDQRPLTQKEIVKHLESFGLDEELVMNRQIGGFSAGQKSKLTLGAAFWTRPHVVALDEPTNYIDMETLDALAKGLTRFKGGVVVISHSSDFVDRVCGETWHVDGGSVTRTLKKEKK